MADAAGDQVLIDIGRVVNKTVRQNEVFCRLGGDEFAVLLPGSQRLRRHHAVAPGGAANHRAGLEFDGVKRRVSASLGIAVYPSHAMDCRHPR